MSDYEVFVLHEGYSRTTSTGMLANCTCTLIKGKKNIIVDTMTPWDRNFLLEKLQQHNLTPSNINFVISTHGHSDHCGNNNLFLEAIHIMGYSVSHKNFYENFSFEHQGVYKIDDYVKVIPTPGHMLAHVSVVVTTKNNDVVIVAGDLFENEDDIHNGNIWKEAGSENVTIQEENRKKVLEMANYIIPGHGKMFEVLSTKHMFKTLKDNNKKTPETVAYYNDTKFGVDEVDQMARKLNTKSASFQWPLQVFFKILDLAAINS